MNLLHLLLLTLVSTNAIFCNKQKRFSNKECNNRNKLLKEEAEEISEILIKRIINLYLVRELKVNSDISIQKIQSINDIIVKEIHNTDKFLLEKEQATFSSKINNLRTFNTLVSTLIQLSSTIKRQHNIGNILCIIKDILRELNKYIINDEIIYQTEECKIFAENQMLYFSKLFLEISIKNLNISMIEKYKFSFSINQKSDCIVCAKEYKLQQNNCLLITKCGHYFCNNCAVKWMNEKTTCPMCRENLSRSQRYAPY